MVESFDSRRGVMQVITTCDEGELPTQSEELYIADAMEILEVLTGKFFEKRDSLFTFTLPLIEKFGFEKLLCDERFFYLEVFVNFAGVIFFTIDSTVNRKQRDKKVVNKNCRLVEKGDSDHYIFARTIQPLR